MRSFSTDAQKALFTARGTQLVMDHDSALEVRDLTTGALVMTLGVHHNDDPAAGHTDRITGFALEEDLGVAVSVAKDNTLRVWDLVSGACRRTMSVPGGSAADVALSRGGRLAVTVHRYEVYAWDLEPGAYWPLQAARAPGDCASSVALATRKNGLWYARWRATLPPPDLPLRRTIAPWNSERLVQDLLSGGQHSPRPDTSAPSCFGRTRGSSRTRSDSSRECARGR
jgi:WD40 repeat protein